MVKCLPAVQNWVQSLGQEDPLEKEMATHFSILPWEIPWTEKPGRLQSMGLQRVEPKGATSFWEISKNKEEVSIITEYTYMLIRKEI